MSFSSISTINHTCPNDTTPLKHKENFNFLQNFILKNSQFLDPLNALTLLCNIEYHSIIVSDILLITRVIRLACSPSNHQLLFDRFDMALKNDLISISHIDTTNEDIDPNNEFVKFDNPVIQNLIREISISKQDSNLKLHYYTMFCKFLNTLCIHVIYFATNNNSDLPKYSNPNKEIILQLEKLKVCPKLDFQHCSLPPDANTMKSEDFINFLVNNLTVDIRDIDFLEVYQLLQFVIMNGNIEGLLALIFHNVPLDKQNYIFKKTKKKMRCVHGLVFYIRKKHPCSALTYAINTEHDEIANLLIFNRFVDPSYNKNIIYTNEFIAATRKKNIRIMMNLLHFGGLNNIDFNGKDWRKATALNHAVKKNFIEGLYLLLYGLGIQTIDFISDQDEESILNELTLETLALIMPFILNYNFVITNETPIEKVNFLVENGYIAPIINS